MVRVVLFWAAARPYSTFGLHRDICLLNAQVGKGAGSPGLTVDKDAVRLGPSAQPAVLYGEVWIAHGYPAPEAYITQSGGLGPRKMRRTMSPLQYPTATSVNVFGIYRSTVRQCALNSVFVLL